MSDLKIVQYSTNRPAVTGGWYEHQYTAESECEFDNDGSTLWLTIEASRDSDGNWQWLRTGLDAVTVTVRGVDIVQNVFQDAPDGAWFFTHAVKEAMERCYEHDQAVEQERTAGIP